MTPTSHDQQRTVTPASGPAQEAGPPFAPSMPSATPTPAREPPAVTNEAREPASEERRTSPLIAACIQSMEARFADREAAVVDVQALYGSRGGPWLRRVHEVLYAWSLRSELPAGYCTYRYSGMETALQKKCGKVIKLDAVTKILRILADAGVIARPDKASMKRLPREGLGYPLKVLVPPPRARDTQARVLTQVLGGVEDRVALDVIGDYLHERLMCIGMPVDESDAPAWTDRIASILRSYVDGIHVNTTTG